MDTLEQQAIANLETRRRDRRKVTNARVARFVQRHLAEKTRITSHHLWIASINDLVCYMWLSSMANRTRPELPGLAQGAEQFLQMLQCIHLAFVPGSVARNEFIEHNTFAIECIDPALLAWIAADPHDITPPNPPKAATGTL